MLRRLRSTLGETSSSLSPPLSRYRWLRALTYLAVGWIVLFVTVFGAGELIDDYHLPPIQGVMAGLAQGTAVVLALWRPTPAWTLSLSATVVTALTARGSLVPDPSPSRIPFPPPGSGPGAGAGPGWPWSTPEMLAHTAVLVLLALRLPARRAIAALVVSGLATSAVQGIIGARGYTATGVAAVTVFAVAVLVGGALRGRREARTQLVEQTTITAEERARRTLLEERSRIARELHDVVAHHMSVISIQAQVAPHLVQNPSEELKENLAGIRHNALEALAELRRVLGVLRSENPDDPYGLGEPGTRAAPDAPQPTLDRLDALAENTRAAGLTVAMRVEDTRDEPQPYPPGVELSAYRIVQEALSNTLRHAPGSTVRVEVTHLPKGLHLSVVNSRPERPVPPSPGAGHGLLGMRERATMLGGHVTATRTLHGGFAVSAFLPRDGTAPLTGPEPEPGPEAEWSRLPVVYSDPPDTPVVHVAPPGVPAAGDGGPAAPVARKDVPAPGSPPPTGEESP
ncbi:sensor histidine kinase [Streptomyces sp. MMS24-I31]|uniref:sensor histidine kinase n=1 Tax=Streptomyces sp. MMS24-I31 TaxID=3351563 RepID=UPI003896DC6D